MTTGINHPLNPEEQFMFSNSDQLTSATKALFESQIAAFRALSSETIEGVEKTIALNIGATKASVENSIAVAKQLSSAKDPQEFFSLAAAHAKPNAEKVTSYSRDLTDIASGLRAAFSKTAEAQFTETKSKITALVDNVTKSAPAGSEQAVAILKSHIDNASVGVEPQTKATKQTVEAQEVNATEQFSPATEDSVPKAVKK
jgi:phasin family protein